MRHVIVRLLSAAPFLLGALEPLSAQDGVPPALSSYVRDIRTAYGKIEKGCPPDSAFHFSDVTGDGQPDLIVDLSKCKGFCGATGACGLDVYVSGRKKKHVKGFGPIPEGQFLVRGQWSLGSAGGKAALIQTGECPGQSNQRCEFLTVWNGQKFDHLPARSIGKIAEGPRSATVSGTGFFIDGSGRIITNAHVVSDCSSMVVQTAVPSPAKLLFRDDALDLALLKIEGTTAFANFRVGVRLGETVAAFGFPLRGVLAQGGNFTIGSVTALSGLRDDARKLQISAPVQSGNSGGPLLDEWGNVVGVVVSRLAIEGVNLATQNVNFAIKAGTVVEFAERGGVALSFSQNGPGLSQLKMPEVAERAAQFTMPITCHK